MQEVIALLAEYLRNIEDDEAKCNLCGQIVSNLWIWDDIDPEDINCEEVCPFRFSKCMRVCRTLSEAAVTATEYQCEALKCAKGIRPNTMCMKALMVIIPAAAAVEAAVVVVRKVTSTGTRGPNSRWRVA